MQSLPLGVRILPLRTMVQIIRFFFRLRFISGLSVTFDCRWIRNSKASTRSSNIRWSVSMLLPNEFWSARTYWMMDLDVMFFGQAIVPIGISSMTSSNDTLSTFVMIFASLTLLANRESTRFSSSRFVRDTKASVSSIPSSNKSWRSVASPLMIITCGRESLNFSHCSKFCSMILTCKCADSKCFAR